MSTLPWAVFLPSWNVHSSISIAICSALLCFWTAQPSGLSWDVQRGTGLPSAQPMTSLCRGSVWLPGSRQPASTAAACAEPSAHPWAGTACACACGSVREGRATWLSQIGLRRLNGHLWVTFSCRGQIDAMMHIWAVEQMQQFQPLWGTLLESPAGHTTGLGTQHTSQELSQPGRLLSAIPGTFVVRALHFACFCSSVCVWHGQCSVVICSLSQLCWITMAHTSGLCVLWFFNPLTNVLCPSTERDFSIWLASCEFTRSWKQADLERSKVWRWFRTWFRLEYFLTLGCQGYDCETVMSPCWIIQVVKKTSWPRQKTSKQMAQRDTEENYVACLHECLERASLLSAEPGFAFLLKKKK